MTQDVLHQAPQNPLKSSVNRSLKIIHSSFILQLRKCDIREVEWLGSNDSTSTQAFLWEDYLTKQKQNKKRRVGLDAKQPFTPWCSLNCQGTSWVEPEPTGPTGNPARVREDSGTQWNPGKGLWNWFAHPTIIYWPRSIHAVIWWASLGHMKEYWSLRYLLSRFMS